MDHNYEGWKAPALSAWGQHNATRHDVEVRRMSPLAMVITERTRRVRDGHESRGLS